MTIRDLLLILLGSAFGAGWMHFVDQIIITRLKTNMNKACKIIDDLVQAIERVGP